MYLRTDILSQFSPKAIAETSFGQPKGFTLTELLTSGLITGVVISLSGIGLVNLTQITQKSEQEIEHRDRLTLALDFIANDIKESKSISTIVTQNRDADGYTSIFEVTRHDNSTVTYYTTDISSDTPWVGPKVVYRYASSDPGPDPHALVDAIADVNPSCSNIGSESSNSQGLNVFIQDSEQAKICLVGQLAPGNTLQVETHAFARSSASP